MKKLLAVLLALTLCLATSALANETIVIGATATPHAIILELVKDDYAALGYDMDIVVVTDYYISNPSTAAGEMHCNYFQHVPFLTEYNLGVDEDEQLVAAIGVHSEPYGIYPGTKKSLADVSKGDAIAITNDPANQTRALLLLSDAGLIKLPEGSDFSSILTIYDVVENPYNLEFVEMSPELITAALEDVAFGVVNGNYAMDAGLNVATDALFTETEGDAGKAFTNYVVVKPADVEADWLKALEQVLLSEKVYNFILTNEAFGGGVVPAFAIEAAEEAAE